MTREVLDLDRINRQGIPLQAILFLSATVGVAAGIACLLAATALAIALVPGGIVAAFWATVMAGVYGVQLVVAGLAAIILIPIGAIVSAHLKLRSFEDFIVEASGAVIKPDSDRNGTMVAELARRAGLPRPPRYGALEGPFNAAALSIDHGTSLVLVAQPPSGMSVSEVRAIIGHELGHIAMGDSRRKLLAQGHQEFLVFFLRLVGLGRVGRWTFGIIGELALMAYSREREFWADAVGAYLTSPADMLLALRRLEAAERAAATSLERQYPALMFAHFGGNLFSTHPGWPARIKAIEEQSYVRRLPVRETTDDEVPAGSSAPPVSYEGI